MKTQVWTFCMCSRVWGFPETRSLWLRGQFQSLGLRLPSICRWGDGGLDRPNSWLKVTQIMSGHSALVQTFNPIPREKTAGFSARTASPLLCPGRGAASRCSLWTKDGGERGWPQQREEPVTGPPQNHPWGAYVIPNTMMRVSEKNK